MEALKEYQDYLLAYRLRALVGGRLRPERRELSLADYAQKRLERQRLAGELIGKEDYHGQMRRVDALTDQLNFGFWHNPCETVEVLKVVIEQGGCSALETPEAFTKTLLTPFERSCLSAREGQTVGSYYLGLLRASAAYQDAEVFTRLRAEVEPLREQFPVFINVEQDGPLV